MQAWNAVVKLSEKLQLNLAPVRQLNLVMLVVGLFHGVLQILRFPLLTRLLSYVEHVAGGDRKLVKNHYESTSVIFNVR